MEYSRQQEDTVSAKTSYIDDWRGAGHIHLLGEAPQETRYKAAMEAFRTLYESIPEPTKKQRRILKEIMFLLREVEIYGFKFAPSLYTDGFLNKIESLMASINQPTGEHSHA